VNVDTAKAVQRWEQAAEQGHAEAQHNLGICYAKGEGVKLDMTKAVQLWGQAV
jgi:TPR repeat protein